MNSELRTSKTHPLTINSLPAGRGMLGLTFCPGKKQAQSMTGGWNRDMGIDLAAIQHWGADIVISLMERFEYAEIGVGTLPKAFNDHFHLWLDLPIIDKTAPNATWMQQWRLIRIIVAQALHEGRRILIHCKGGIGRTGTIAAMILHDLKIPMSSAVEQVRAVRKGAIETLQQEDFLEHYLSPPLTEELLARAALLFRGAINIAADKGIDENCLASQFYDSSCVRMIQRLDNLDALLADIERFKN